jgi:O-antigen/teichoic acid export membrane protein
MLRIRERLIQGTVLNLIAVAFNQGSTLFINVIVARILLIQAYGEYAMVQITVLTMASMAQLATGFTAAKYVAEYRSSFPERAGRIIGVCAVVSVMTASVGTILLVVMAPWLSASVLKAPHLEIALIAGAGFLFFSAINGYQTGALSGLEAYGGLSKAGVLSGVVAVSAVSLGAWIYGLNGALIGLSISALSRCLIHNNWLRFECKAQGIKPCYSGLGQEKTVITKFVLPAAIAGYITLPILWLANALLVRQPGGYGEIALYASSSSVRLLVLFIPQVINTVSVSILNNIKGSGDKRRYERVYKANVLTIFIATLTFGLFFGIYGDAILGIFGRDFSAGKTVLQLLMISTVFEGSSIALYQHLQVQEKIWTSLFLISIPRETLFIVIAFLLVPSLGAVGLSIAYTLGWFLALTIIAVLIYKDQIFRTNNPLVATITI